VPGISGFEQEHEMAIACFILVGLGVLLILLGAYMSLEEWKKELDKHPKVKEQSLADNLKGLAKLAEAIKGYPRGQQLIVWGIVIIIIGAMFGGVSGLVACKACNT
jgi:hypothetical protein